MQGRYELLHLLGSLGDDARTQRLVDRRVAHVAIEHRLVHEVEQNEARISTSTGEQHSALNRRLGRISAANKNEYLSEHAAHPPAAAVRPAIRITTYASSPMRRDAPTWRYVFVLSDARRPLYLEWHSTER